MSRLVLPIFRRTNPRTMEDGERTISADVYRGSKPSPRCVFSPLWLTPPFPIFLRRRTSHLLIRFRMAARAQVVANDSAVAVVETEAAKLLRMEASLIQTLTSAGVSTATMTKLLDAGVSTTAIFCNIASSHDTMGEYLTAGVGLNVQHFRSTKRAPPSVRNPSRQSPRQLRKMLTSPLSRRWTLTVYSASRQRASPWLIPGIRRS